MLVLTRKVNECVVIGGNIEVMISRIEGDLVAALRQRGLPALRRQGEVEKPMGVIEGRTQDLTAGQILEGRRNAPPHRSVPGFDRLGDREPRQGRAIEIGRAHV